MTNIMTTRGDKIICPPQTFKTLKQLKLIVQIILFTGCTHFVDKKIKTKQHPREQDTMIKKKQNKTKQKQFLSIGFFFSINLHRTKAIPNNKKFKATKKAESVKRQAKRQNQITQNN